MLQGDGEDRGVELRLDGVEECGLGLRLDGVDGAEGQAEKTVVVLVVDELLADLGGGFDSLAGGLDTADGDGIFVDITASGALVTVLDLPGGASNLGAVVAGLVNAVASLLGSGQLRREDPTTDVSVPTHFDGWQCMCITYRSAEPVSKSRFIVVPPTLTGVRYSSSSFSGVVTAEPLSAAALTLAGTEAPYLASALAYMPGKFRVLVPVAGRASWLTVKLLLRAPPIGTAEATERQARPTVILLKTTILKERERRMSLKNEVGR